MRPNRLRVVHVVPAMTVGGLPRVAETLCSEADRSHFDVRILALLELGEIADEMRARGLRVDLLPGADPSRPDRLAPWKVYRYLRENPVDVVHTHNTQAMMEAMPGAALARVPTRIHTDHARLYPDARRYVLAERWLSRLTNRVVAVSEHTAQDLQTHQRIAAHKLTVIPNGVEGSRFTGPVDRLSKRAELGIPADAPVLGLAARLVDQKGIVYLLRALPEILRKFPDLQLLLAGDGDLAPVLRAEAEALGVTEHVRFLGVRRDVPELFRIMDLFMLPSHWEGLPMSVLEAMAAGLPIVGSDVGGVSTAVVDGETGRLLPPGDPAAIAEATCSLLADPDRRQAFSANAQKRYWERFSGAAMTRAYERLYRGLEPEAAL